MPDVVKALMSKKRILQQTKISVQREAEKKLAEINAEIAKVDSALSVVNNAVLQYLCPKCKGTGTVRKADAVGDMEDWQCDRCKGTGIDMEDA